MVCNCSLLCVAPFSACMGVIVILFVGVLTVNKQLSTIRVLT